MIKILLSNYNKLWYYTRLHGIYSLITTTFTIVNLKIKEKKKKLNPY